MLEMECACSQGRHTAPIKNLEVSSGAIEKLPQILADRKHICLVSDETTYEIAGRHAEELLRAAGKQLDVVVLPRGTMATAEHVGELLIRIGKCPDPYDINAFSQNPDYVLAVGSGSVNDISRMVSYRLGLEYGVCGTAPSMDGYISVVAPLLVGGKKIIYTCSTARDVIIDLDICAAAPRELLLAGIGDMIGKPIAILDWQLSTHFTGEYYCEKTAGMVLEAAAKCVDCAFRVDERKPEDVRAIADGLLMSGLGIAYTGTSRPASGTEHMVGQTWEVIGLERRHAPHYHGVEVGEATFTAMAMYRRLYAETKDEAVRALIAPYLPVFGRTVALQEKLHMEFAVTDREIFLEGVHRGRTFRERYTLLQYLYDNGMLDDYAEYGFAETMKVQ